MPSRQIQTVTMLLATALLTGCKLAIIVPSGGDVTSQSGTRNCTGGNLCEFNITEANFSESFTAVAKPGYVFSKWHAGPGFLCANSTNLNCLISNVGAAGNPIIDAVIASGQFFYAMPLFEFVGIDTDGDGVKDHLDEDDDNDGFLDGDDLCPLDPDTACGYYTISGSISEDTTWTNENGPIRLAGQVVVEPEVSLSIAPGTEIFGSEGSLRVLDGAVLSVNGALLDHLDISQAPQGRVYILGTQIIGGNPSKQGGESGEFQISGCTLEDVQMTVARTEGGFPTVVTGNTFLGTTKLQIRVNPSITAAGPINISYNHFSGYTAPVITGEIEAPAGNGVMQININNNSFLAPGIPTFGLASTWNGWTGTVNATNNYWGTTDASIVEDMIYDQSTFSTGDIAFLPLLEAP